MEVEKVRKEKSFLRSFLAICLVASAGFAQSWHWTKDDLALNPSGLDLEGVENFALGDLDKDGFVDIVVVGIALRLKAFRGLATEKPPYWEEAPVLLSGLPNSKNVGGLTLTDLDGDDRLDLVLRERNFDSDVPVWKLLYWKRDSLGHWYQAPNYFLGIPEQETGYRNDPVFRDCDSDQDLDMIFGTEDKHRQTFFRFYRNIGDATFPMWQEDSTRICHLNNKPIGYESWSPFLTHMNGDTLLDLGIAYVIEGLFGVAFYPGIRDSAGLTWSDEVQQDLLSPPNSWYHGSIQKVLPFDMNQDERDDLIILEPQHTGRIYLATSRQESYFDLSYFQIGPLQFLWLAPVNLFDYDKDSIFELLIPHAKYSFWGWDIWFQFHRKAHVADWTLWQGTAGFSLDYGSTGNHYSAQIVDLDKNGLTEVVYADEEYAPLRHDILRVYENTDPFLQGDWMLRKDLLAPFSGGNRDTTYSDPSLADLNGDRELDLFITERIFSGNEVTSVRYCFFEAGRVIDDSFRCVPTWVRAPHWLSGLEDTLYYHSTFADIDQDGDQDLIFGTEKGTAQAYLNIGDTRRPKWQKDDSVFSGIEIGQNAIPTFGDLDEDGRPDLFLGNREGTLRFYRNETAVHVEGGVNKMSDSFELNQNYPNPFNPEATIRYELPKSGFVTIKVYDLASRLVKVLVDGWQTAGTQSTVWDGTNSIGKLVATGIYIYQIEFTGVNGQKLQQSRKMCLVR